MCEVITTAFSESRDDKKFFKERMNYTIEKSSYVLAWLSCHDLAMILTRVQWLTRI